MVEREKLTMKADFNFEALEAETWQDLIGFSRQIIMNGKAYEAILPPSARQNARYLMLIFYNFVLNVDKKTDYMTTRIQAKKTGGEFVELPGSRGSTWNNNVVRSLFGTTLTVLK
jgi:hypothetical protein